ncbi:MAG: hypothetical protein N2314_06355 [Brevinematales bacterium]|nr:hypothetical protein [Brevinematales bacterium]
MGEERVCDIALIIGKQDKDLLSLDVYTHHYLLPFTPRVRTIDFVVSSLVNTKVNPLLVLTPEDADLLHDYLVKGWPENEIYVFDKHKTEMEFLPFLETLQSDHRGKTIGIFYGHFPNWFFPPAKRPLPTYAVLCCETPQAQVPVGVVLPFRAFQEGIRATSQTNLYDFLEGLIDTLAQEKRMQRVRLLGYFRPHYTIEEYYQIHMDMLEDYYFLDHLNSLVPVRPFTLPNIVSRTYRSSHVINSLVGENVHIYGRVENSIIFSNVIVDKKAVIKNSVILPGNHIGSEAHIEHTLIDEFSLENTVPNIGAKSRIGSLSAIRPNEKFPQLSSGLTVIGKDVVLPEKSVIGGNCYVESFLPPSVLKRHHVLRDGESLVHEG